MTKQRNMIPQTSFIATPIAWILRVMLLLILPLTVEAQFEYTESSGTDLSDPTWTPVETNVLAAGESYFSDPTWAEHPARFYRLRSP